jgi:hypothetical protein
MSNAGKRELSLLSVARSTKFKCGEFLSDSMGRRRKDPVDVGTLFSVLKGFWDLKQTKKFTKTLFGELSGIKKNTGIIPAIKKDTSIIPEIKEDTSAMRKQLTRIERKIDRLK